MQIEKNKAVAINYTLTDNDGNVLDTSEGREPLHFLHGHGNLIIGLEEALEGKKEGDKLEVTVDPEKGYGHFQKEMIQKVPKEHLEQVPDLKEGMQIQGKNEQGVQIFTVTSITEEEVELDGNHPLAGMTLNFNVEVASVREANPDEITHGHVHGPGGHQH